MAAVPKSNSGFHLPGRVPTQPVCFWSFHVEETNKATVPYSTLVLSLTENDLLGNRYLAANEEGLLTSDYGKVLTAEKVYRAVGSCVERNIIQEKLFDLGQHVPILAGLLPLPKVQSCTSEWFAVTSRARSKH